MPGYLRLLYQGVYGDGKKSRLQAVGYGISGVKASQFCGSWIMYVSTAPVPDRPQLLVNRTRRKSAETEAWGSAQ